MATDIVINSTSPILRRGEPARKLKTRLDVPLRSPRLEVVLCQPQVPAAGGRALQTQPKKPNRAGYGEYNQARDWSSSACNSKHTANYCESTHGPGIV